MASINIVKVVREFHPVKIERGVRFSIGQQVDKCLERCLEVGDEVQTISLELAEEDWQKIRDEGVPHTLVKERKSGFS